MEVITIESKAYQELILKLDRIHEFIQTLSPVKGLKQAKEIKDEREKDVWLDSNAVCEQLKISTRTLFRLRKERKIAYSIVRGHYRFKQSDVEQFLNENVVIANPETFEEIRQAYQTIYKR